MKPRTDRQIALEAWMHACCCVRHLWLAWVELYRMAATILRIR